MIPLYDESRSANTTSWITVFLIVSSAVIFFVTYPELDSFVGLYGIFPDAFLSGRNIFSAFTSLFLHANIAHLLGNMLFLWVFGESLERKFGGLKFLLFYLACALGAAFLYSFAAVDKTVPAIGASGAIAGILGGYFIFFPKNKIKSLVPLIFLWVFWSVPAVFFIALWFALQFFGVLYGGTDMVAYWGHIGGFFTGFFLAGLLKKF
ncbi:MAG: rhomboid family intramembrane serine protease [Candidatus Paceibacterota bacterium]|jgi:membrane associated rhomboid family serine protease